MQGNVRNARCILCGEVWRAADESGDTLEYSCLCSDYSITKGAKEQLLARPGDLRLRIAWLARDFRERGVRLQLDESNLAAIAADAPQQGDPLERADFLLRKLSEYPRLGAVDVNLEDYSRYRCANPAELGALINFAADDLHYIRKEGGGARILAKGWERLRELRGVGARSDQVFVAMSFRPEVAPAYAGGIKSAIEECGYKALRVDEDPRDELTIDDRILAGIRESALVVADFSFHRPNVYLEAGFAMGLGLPVVRTVRSSDAETMHFDQEHYPYIRWETPEELREKLSAHIRARYPRRK